MSKTCVFFGHRDARPDEAELERAIRTMIVEHGATTFWCGGYGTFDSHAARAVHRLKQEFPHLELLLILAYLPGKNTHVSEIFDGTLFPEELESVPRRFAILRRNRWMAQRCDMAVCLINRTYGGAHTAFSAINRSEKIVLNLGKI